MKQHKTAQKQGIGLFTYEQEKNATAFDYFAEIVIGTIVVSLGITLGYFLLYQSPTRSTEGLLTSAMLIVIGIFFAHAGAIFWYRRLRKRKPSN